MKRVILLLAIMYGVASASAATMGEKIAQGWLPVMVPPGQTLDGLLTTTDGGSNALEPRIVALEVRTNAWDAAAAHTNLALAGGAHGGLSAAILSAAGGMTNLQPVTLAQLPAGTLTNGNLTIGYSNNMIYFNIPLSSCTGVVFNVGGTNILLKQNN